ILSVGRIVGETAALLFTAGFAHSLNGFFDGLSQSGSTLTVALYIYAKEHGEFEIAFAIATVLLILTFIINLSAESVGYFFKKRRNL
ncbi:MAG: phosphate ABC transporter, permease protein PstA, partial [Clostridia bacterium]|nr:phosphate ABC transporter, permease protein PstA [Clostridia bacterium]